MTQGDWLRASLGRPRPRPASCAPRHGNQGRAGPAAPRCRRTMDAPLHSLRNQELSRARSPVSHSRPQEGDSAPDVAVHHRCRTSCGASATAVTAGPSPSADISLSVRPSAVRGFYVHYATAQETPTESRRGPWQQPPLPWWKLHTPSVAVHGDNGNRSPRTVRREPGEGPGSLTRAATQQPRHSIGLPPATALRLQRPPKPIFLWWPSGPLTQGF
jgi:hypothetical protein